MPTIREGRWDCTVCGTSGNLGRDKVCTHCGYPRPEGVEFYLPEGEPPVSKPDLLRDAKAGPDWACKNCGATNAGYRYSCTQCAAPKPIDAKTQKVTDYALEDVPRYGDRGPQTEMEWVCANCGGHNPESRDECLTCGVRRGEIGSQKYNRQSLGKKQKEHKIPQIDRPKSLPFVGSPTNRRWLAVAAGFAGLLLFICAIWFFFVRTNQIPLNVTGFQWERSVNVEIYATVTEEDWSVPAGGRVVSQHSAIHHYESVLDHYETKYRQACSTVPDGYEPETYQDCQTVQTGSDTYVCGRTNLGNGYFEDIECSRPSYETRCDTRSRQVPKYREVCHPEPYQDPVFRQEPRYATKYTYEIEKWVQSRSPKSSGNDKNAAWPNVSLAGNEKEAGRAEKYLVFFKDEKGTEYSKDMSFDQWATFNLGETVTAEVNAVGQILSIKSK